MASRNYCTELHPQNLVLINKIYLEAGTFSLFTFHLDLSVVGR